MRRHADNACHGVDFFRGGLHFQRHSLFAIPVGKRVGAVAAARRDRRARRCLHGWHACHARGVARPRNGSWHTGPPSVRRHQRRVRREFRDGAEGRFGRRAVPVRSGDVWHASKLATQMHEFDCRPELRFLCSDARRVDAAGVGLRRSLFDVLKVTSSEFRRIHASRGFEVLLRRSLATGATVALRRSLAIEAMPFAPGWVHDEWLAILAAARDGFDCLEEALIDYRQHDANQIGMPDRNLRQKWNDLVDPRAAKVDALVRRSEVLLQRRRDMPGVKPDYLEMALQKREHLRIRQRFRGPPWRRARGVVRESLGGRYRLYSSGWRSALR